MTIGFFIIYILSILPGNSMHFKKDEFESYNDFTHLSADNDVRTTLSLSNVTAFLFRDFIVKTKELQLYYWNEKKKKTLADLKTPTRIEIIRCVSSHLGLEIFSKIVEQIRIPVNQENLQRVAAFPELRHPYGHGTRKMRIIFPNYALGTFEKPNERIPLLSLSFSYDLALAEWLCEIYDYRALGDLKELLVKLARRHIEDFREVIK